MRSAGSRVCKCYANRIERKSWQRDRERERARERARETHREREGERERGREGARQGVEREMRLKTTPKYRITLAYIHQKKKFTDYEQADACKEGVTKAACEELADFPNLCTLTACQQLVTHVSSCRNT